MDVASQEQLRMIHRVLDVLSTAGVRAWLFGGWGLDARIGRITRDHGDVEFWVERTDAARSRGALVAAGATALATQPPEEACEFVWDAVDFSTAYFDRRADGAFVQLHGRFSDWVLPPDSFGAEPGVLDGVAVPAMSVAGMLAMKEQFPTLRHGRPWREKDIGDLAVLRRLLDQETRGRSSMEGTSLTDVVERLLGQAATSRSGRAAQTLYGGHDHSLRQTVIALAAEHELAEHESPGEATLQVLAGRVRLTAGDDHWEGDAGGFVAIPPARHALTALEPSAILLTVRLSA